MKKPAIGLVAIIVLAIVALVAAFLLSEPPPPETVPPDLQIVRYNIPAESNAYTYFLRATNYMCYPESRDAEMKISDMLDRRTNWDAQFVSGILFSNDEALAEIDRGLACSKCQMPPRQSSLPLMSHLTSWRELGRCMALRTRCLFLASRQEEAFESARKSMEFGRLIHEGSGSLIEYMAGSGIRRLGLNELESMAGRCSLSSSGLVNYATAAMGCEDNPEGYRNVLVGEYRTACDFVDRFEQDCRTNAYGRLVASLARTSYFFQPAAMKRSFRETCRQWIRDAEKPLSLIVRDEPEDDDGHLSQFLMPNALGRPIQRFMLPSFRGMMATRCKARATTECCRLLLVLKAYQVDHGHLPATLDALVPDYQKQVPTDPYDGRPMRYSAEKKIVYSVGENLKDEGGSEATPPPGTSYNSRWNDPDLVFHADF